MLKHVTRYPVVIVVLSMLFCFAPPLIAQDEESTLFATNEVLDIKLIVDFDTLCRPREVDNCEYAPTDIFYKTREGEERSIPAEIRIRGGWRSRKNHCKVPPLFVRFIEGKTSGSPFAGEKILPLTTHCKSRRSVSISGGSTKGSAYEQYVLKEYLGYRIFNIIDDKSIRVRLLHIEYVQPGKRGKTIQRYAFFAEHFNAMAARYHAELLPGGSFDHERINLTAIDNVALFNFMIGNTDSSIVRERNVVLIGVPEADAQQFPVPFDLDMAGLVDAEYSGVSPRLNFRNPKQRMYLGFCHPQVDFDALFKRFLENEAAIIALPNEIPGMSRSSRKKTRKYLKQFFAVLNSEKDRAEHIIDACLPWPPSPDDHTTPPESSQPES